VQICLLDGRRDSIEVVPTSSRATAAQNDPTSPTALAMNTSKIASPASSKKRVFTPQISDAESFSASASVTNWLIETPSFSAASRTARCSESGSLRLNVSIVCLSPSNTAYQHFSLPGVTYVSYHSQIVYPREYKRV
jgi:hypothetical protein